MASPPPGPGTPLEVFLAFLRLGLSSFGGPVAHLGYFRAELVERRQWLDDRSYSDVVALCQFLPGPASSQVGMALGLRRAGWAGSLAAWLGFTLPSALAMIAFAYGVAAWPGLADSAAVRGLKVAAVAVVAQAVWGMGRSLCTDRLRTGIAVGAALLCLAMASSAGQVAAIVMGGIIGRWLIERAPPLPAPAGEPIAQRRSWPAWLAFTVLLIGLPLWAAASGSPVVSLVNGVYRAGALVFGGGHVVLPLLQTAAVQGGFVAESDFLAGYGAAQAVPGPLFSFAAFLGSAAQWPLHGWTGGLLLLCVVFLPGFLLLVGVLPWWQRLQPRGGIRAAMAGINAAVVGVLGAALYDPVWTSAIHGRSDFAVALAAFGLLAYAKLPPWAVVLFSAAAAWALAALPR